MNLKSEEYSGHKIWFKKINGSVEAKVSLGDVWYAQFGESKSYVFNRMKHIINNYHKKHKIQNHNLVKFKTALKNNKCPFCGNTLKFYDGALGYEALRCEPCNLSIDNNGIHLEDRK